MRLKSISTLKKAWFVFEDDPDKAKFEIGVLSPGEEREVQSASSRMELGEAGNNLTFDHNKASFLRAVRCIRSWDGVFQDEKAEKALVCNDLNKSKLLNSVPGLEAWVIEKHNELTAEVAKAREEEEKNS